MPFVIIKYGPYYAHGLIQHRIQKASGIFARLNQLGYEIEITPINQFNRLSIEMYERASRLCKPFREIFRCDIRNLMFNMSYEDDAVCDRAVAAVEEARIRMSHDYNNPRFISIDKGTRELQATPHVSLAKVLPSDVELLYEHFPHT